MFNVFRDWQWRYQNYVTDTILIYNLLTLDMFFSRLPSQSYIVFCKHSMCSIVKWCLHNWISLLLLSRWQLFPSKLEHFLIQNTFRQPPLLWLLVTSAMNQYLTLKINHTDKRLVFQIICIYRYSKCYLMLNFICIFCLSWKFFYSRDRISILFYIYDMI